MLSAKWQNHDRSASVSVQRYSQRLDACNDCCIQAWNKRELEPSAYRSSQDRKQRSQHCNPTALIAHQLSHEGWSISGVQWRSHTRTLGNLATFLGTRSGPFSDMHLHVSRRSYKAQNQTALVLTHRMSVQHWFNMCSCLLVFSCSFRFRPPWQWKCSEKLPVSKIMKFRMCLKIGLYYCAQEGSNKHFEYDQVIFLNRVISQKKNKFYNVSRHLIQTLKKCKNLEYIVTYIEYIWFGWCRSGSEVHTLEWPSQLVLGQSASWRSSFSTPRTRRRYMLSLPNARLYSLSKRNNNEVIILTRVN